jgi:hypothetical protein
VKNKAKAKATVERIGLILRVFTRSKSLNFSKPMTRIIAKAPEIKPSKSTKASAESKLAILKSKKLVKE